MKNGTVRFFLTSGIPMIQDMTKQQRELLEEFSNMSKAFLGFGPITWITNHCTVVPQSEWSTGQSSGNSGGGFIEGRQLYDCATMH
jgi:hypothetical protein